MYVLLYFQYILKYSLFPQKKRIHYINLTSNIVFIWQLRFFHLTTSYYKHFSLKYFYKYVPDDSFYKPKYVACNLALK